MKSNYKNLRAEEKAGKHYARGVRKLSNELKEMNVTKKQIIAINLEDYDFYDLRDPKKLYAYIKERLLPDQMNYIFLDEIQQCEDFQEL